MPVHSDSVLVVPLPTDKEIFELKHLNAICPGDTLILKQKNQEWKLSYNTNVTKEESKAVQNAVKKLIEPETKSESPEKKNDQAIGDQWLEKINSRDKEFEAAR